MRRGRSCRARRAALLLACGTVLLLSGATPARGQLGYTGVPPTSPSSDVYVGDTYAGLYLGPSPSVATAAGGVVRSSGPASSGTAATLSVADAALNDGPPEMAEGDRRLVTPWDVVSIAALGLTAVAGLSASAGRFRSR